MMAAGQAQAAGQLGQSAAWQQTLGDLSSLGTNYLMNQPPTYTTDYSIPMTSWSD